MDDNTQDPNGMPADDAVVEGGDTGAEDGGAAPMPEAGAEPMPEGDTEGGEDAAE